MIEMLAARQSAMPRSQTTGEESPMGNSSPHIFSVGFDVPV
jgi:hypothetical protein